MCTQKFAAVRGQNAVEERVATEADVNIEASIEVENDVPETKNEQMVDERVKNNVPETQVETMHDDLIANVSHFPIQFPMLMCSFDVFVS